MPSIFVSGQGARLAVAGTTAPGYGSAAVGGVSSVYDRVALGTPSGFSDSTNLVHDLRVGTSGTGRSAINTFNLSTIDKGTDVSQADGIPIDPLHQISGHIQILYGTFDIHGNPVTTPLSSGVGYARSNNTSARVDGTLVVDAAAEPGYQYRNSYHYRLGGTSTTKTRSIPG